MRLKVPAAATRGRKSNDRAASTQTRSVTQRLKNAVIVIVLGQISTAC
jgi:hypothetical protein